MFRTLVPVFLASLLASTALAQTLTLDELQMKQARAFCQTTLKGTPTNEGCTVDGELRSWAAVIGVAYIFRDKTPIEPAVLEFCEFRLGGFPAKPGCRLGSGYLEYSTVAERMKAEAGVKYPGVEPGQWKLTFTGASGVTVPPEQTRCITAKDAKYGLPTVTLQGAPVTSACAYVKNSDKDGVLDIDMKCDGVSSTTTMTFKGTFTPKKFQLDHTGTHDVTGKDAGNWRWSYVVAGEWQSATCKQ